MAGGALGLGGTGEPDGDGSALGTADRAGGPGGGSIAGMLDLTGVVDLTGVEDFTGVVEVARVKNLASAAESADVVDLTRLAEPGGAVHPPVVRTAAPMESGAAAGEALPWSAQWRFAKRTIDVVLASLLLVLLSPLLLTVAVAIRIDSPGGVLFRQRRAGWRGREFGMFKFRSMVDGAERMWVDLTEHNETDGLLFKMRDDPRVTRVGAVIRRYSIDELPNLINVVLGDMSLVGPRPLAVPPCSFGPVDGRRLYVRPGITGYWQIAGRRDTSYERMVELDLAYLANSGPLIDLLILARTLPAVVRARGAY